MRSRPCWFRVEKDNEYVRYHAKQAIVLGIVTCAAWIGISVVFAVLGFLPIIGGIIAGLLGTLVWLAFSVVFLVVWIVSMVKAYQGQRYQIPVIGDFATTWQSRPAH